MRVGQKNKLTYRWATKGSRPRAVHDQRTQSTYVFGAVCPTRGAGAALVLPACNTEAMQLRLNEIATKVTPGAHAVVVLDQAGWHKSQALKDPSNISLLPLPPRSPELNPQENIWQFMRQNWLSNRTFKSFDDIVDYCCYAWNTLIDQPWKIMSIAQRDWATVRQCSMRIGFRRCTRTPRLRLCGIVLHSYEACGVVPRFCVEAVIFGYIFFRPGGPREGRGVEKKMLPVSANLLVRVAFSRVAPEDV